MAGQAPGELVGRTAELAVLDVLLEHTASGAGGAVLLVGEPGIGKTRLAAECAGRAAAVGYRVAWGRCRESAGAPPLWPWRQVLRQLGRPTRGFSSADPVDTRVGTAAGSATRFRLFEQVVDGFADAVRERPLLIVLDDVHRADEASLRLLAYLGDALWPAALGLVVAYRDVDLRPGDLAGAVLADLAAGPWSRRCTLSGLSEADVASWLAAVPERNLASSAAQVYHRTAGNPLFVGEAVRLLAEGRDGSAVPASVRELVAERLAQLPAATREVVETAAVLGRDFDYPQLAAAARTSPSAAVDALGAAETARLVVADGVRSGSYCFVHELMRDAVEAQLAASRRAELHARAYTALRDTGWGVATDLAHHAVRARPVLDDATVASAAEAAAEASDAVLAWEDAAHWWATARRLRAGVGRPDPALSVRLGGSLLRGGQVGAARALFESVAAEAGRAGDQATLASCALAVGDTVAEVAADDGLLDLLDQALRGDDLPVALRVRLLARRAVATYWRHGGPADSRRFSAAAVDLAERSGDPRSLGDALVARQFTLRGPDLLAERIAAGEEVLAIAGRLDDADLRFRAGQWLVPDRFQAGDIGAAVREVETLAAAAERSRNPLYRWWVLVYRGLLAGFAGRDDEAERLAEEAGALGRRLGQPAAQAYRLGQLARLYWRTGRLPGLREELRAAIDQFPGLPTLQCILSLAHVEAGETEPALAIAEALSADGFAALPRDSLYLASLAILGEVAVTCRRRRLAAPVAAALDRYAERNLVQGVPVGWGSAAWHLARLYHVLGDAAAAAHHTETAERLHRRWGAGGLGDPLADLSGPSPTRPAPAAQTHSGPDGSGAPPVPLSPREAEVLALLAAGNANLEIATTLHISVHTVERHVANIFRKLSVRNRAEATGWAHRHGLAD